MFFFPKHFHKNSLNVLIELWSDLGLLSAPSVGLAGCQIKFKLSDIDSWQKGMLMQTIFAYNKPQLTWRQAKKLKIKAVGRSKK